MSGADGVAFDYQGVTYHVEPKALSSKVMKALVRLYDKQAREDVPALLEAMRAGKTEQEREIIKSMFGVVTQRIEKVQHMLQTEEGVATVLHLCCPQLETYEKALELVTEHPSFIELISIVDRCCALEAVGN